MGGLLGTGFSRDVHVLLNTEEVTQCSPHITKSLCYKETTLYNKKYSSQVPNSAC